MVLAAQQIRNLFHITEGQNILVSLSNKAYLSKGIPVIDWKKIKYKGVKKDGWIQNCKTGINIVNSSLPPGG